MATVLLVGGAGYVGSVLASELLGRGYAVRILDRLYFGDHGLAELRDRVELLVGDMRSLPDGALDGIEAVVNVGGPPTIPLPSSIPEPTMK